MIISVKKNEIIMIISVNWTSNRLVQHGGVKSNWRQESEIQGIREVSVYTVYCWIWRLTPDSGHVWTNTTLIERLDIIRPEGICTLCLSIKGSVSQKWPCPQATGLSGARAERRGFSSDPCLLRHALRHWGMLHLQSQLCQPIPTWPRPHHYSMTPTSMSSLKLMS